MERPKSVHLSPEWYRTVLEDGSIRTYPDVRPPRKKTVGDDEDDEPAAPQPSAEPPLPGAFAPKPERKPKVKTAAFGKTPYYFDFIDYYKKAIQLQRRNLGLS